MDYVNVIIVGAGLSGVGAAVHLRQKCPGKTFTLLEGRDTLGGTWDLFRYPGIRSDSDMHTLGFDFEPWTHEKSIADGPAILDYLDRIVDERDALVANLGQVHNAHGVRVIGAAGVPPMPPEEHGAPGALGIAYHLLCKVA